MTIVIFGANVKIENQFVNLILFILTYSFYALRFIIRRWHARASVQGLAFRECPSSHSPRGLR